MEMFYTSIAESAKFIVYVILSFLIIIGLWKKYKSKDPKWANWIHFAIFTHFIIGAFYSGIRMLTTDEINDMLIRRIFACEAWFNFSCAAFYFLALEYIRNRKNKSQ